MPREEQIDPARLEELASMHPLTLVLSNADLEARYRRNMRRDTAHVVRFGLWVAIIVYLLFGALDFWFMRDEAAFAFALTVRGAVLALTTGLLLSNRREWFVRHRELWMLSLVLLLGLGLTVILVSAPETVIDRYYVGYVLMVIAAYTLFMLPFPVAAPLSLILLLFYLALEFVVVGEMEPRVLSNVTFLVSAMLVMGVGGYSAERQRRLAFLRRCLIEREREASEHSALHDPLTGLPNRRLFMEKLTQAVARDVRYQKYCAVLFMDLDGFKAVNDRLGHAVGDALLREVGYRLRKAVRETDTVARLGGDEFVILYEDMEAVDNVDVATRRVFDAFATPFEIDGHTLEIGASVGIALHPVNADTPDELLKLADAFMYEQKLARRQERN